jgi:hypothetical protein
MDLTPEAGPITVQVSVVAPNEKNQQYSGEVKIVNKKNSSDFYIIKVSLATPKTGESNHSLFLAFLERCIR